MSMQTFTGRGQVSKARTAAAVVMLLPGLASAEDFPNPSDSYKVDSSGFTTPYTKTVITSTQAYNTDQNTMKLTYFGEQRSSSTTLHVVLQSKIEVAISGT